MVKPEVKKIIGKLKRKKISIFDIPQEYENDIQLVTFERESGLRITGKRGFDIISNAFFVEEFVEEELEDEINEKRVELSFDKFDSYFDFLNGDIYDNACYTFCHMSEDIITSRKIDVKRLMERMAFIEDTLDDHLLLLVSKDEKESYKNAKQIHKQCRKWVKKFNNCSSYEELVAVVNNYMKSKIFSESRVDISFFFFQYIFTNIEDKQRFSVIMKYMSSGVYPIYNLIYALCSIYDPDDVMRSFNYSHGSKGTIYRHKRDLKEYISCLKNGRIQFSKRAFFDKKTQYYCEEIYGYPKGKRYLNTNIKRYFDTFEEFVDYRKGDLTYCDLSGALECNVDFSNYIIDETTKLPIQTYTDATYSVKKGYRNEKFYVTQQWHDISGNVIRQDETYFDYLFDFVSFLKGDLSQADLLFCDGLRFLEEWDTINFTGAKMRSFLCEKFGLPYDIRKIEGNLIDSFEYIEQNEDETALELRSSGSLTAETIRQELSTVDSELAYMYQRVYYISDIHLLHRLQNAECRSEEDVIYVIQKIVNTIADKVGCLLLIDGDVASDFDIFQLFVKMLSKTLRGHTKVVFTLGNHELWSFSDFSIDQIVSKYRTVLDEHGMYLLYNDILFADSNTEISLIKYHELCQMNEEEISERLRNTRYVILGGLGFSGYNIEFNADNGIYRNTVDRASEIEETKIFEDLYIRLFPILSKKNTIILTHTPKKDWCKEERPDKDLVYVSGHTHRNFFYDDGEYRVYADNQVGYHNDNPHLKSLLIGNDYDCFDEYKDGIYEITRERYNDFYRGKNISMSFQQEINVLYMVKKNGYYCFIHKSRGGNLTILNGGAMKSLEHQNIQYYYDNMEAMISIIKEPLDKFTAFQKHIADTVKKIGGSGNIHGCIIDIDFYNHIYVNPNDQSVTGYWAEDIVNKIAYPSIPALLEKKCPEIFDKYVKLFEGNSENPFALKQQADIASSPRRYLNTDIYRASREIKKMQKLNSNILSSWYEDVLLKKHRIELTSRPK